jgi:transglycosylase-like protein with SLT domain
MDQINALCPGFSKASDNEKKAFWVLVIAAIVKYESNFNPDTRFQEPASLNYVYSEGLLQLSYGDETRYKNMPLDPVKKNILDPAVNLTSGVIILARQMERGKKLFTDKHFYWSVLTRKQVEIKQFIRRHLPQLQFCERK